MLTEDANAEMIEYRVILVQPESRKVLAISAVDGYRLPCISIPPWTRVAEQLQKAIDATWNLRGLVLEVLCAFQGFPRCAVVEILDSDKTSNLQAVAFGQLQSAELSDWQGSLVASLLSGESGTNGLFSRVGWIDELIPWFEAKTGKHTSSKGDIEQYNGDARIALLRILTDDGASYWFKANAEPGEHELAVTQALMKLYPDALPSLVAIQEQWGAWLTVDAGIPLPEGMNLAIMQKAVAAMAGLQRHTVEHTTELLNMGALDRSPLALREHCDDLFVYLEKAMMHQTSTRVPRLDASRLREMKCLTQDACLRMDALGIPATIGHGDMNRGNVVYDGGHCRFLDWREAYVGNPFVGFEHLLLLLHSTGTGEQEATQLKQVYKRAWQDLIPSSTMDAALTLMPVVAGISALYGRGAWLQSEHRDSSGRQRYARNVARYVDRALRSSELSALLSSWMLVGHAAKLPDGSALQSTAISCEEKRLGAVKTRCFHTWNSNHIVQDVRHRMKRFFCSFRRRLGLLISVCSYARLLCESWLLLWLTEFYMRLGGAKALHDIVEKQHTVVAWYPPKWSSRQLCRALDLACVFYFKRIRCLQHSSALTLLLRRYGWKAEMVLGARIVPVTFHAWTQIGKTVVNDGPHVLSTYQVLKRC